MTKIKEKSGGENDGLVSVESAKGKGIGKGLNDFKFLGTLPADHIDLIGHDWSISSQWVKKFTRKKSQFDHFHFYEKIVRNLQKL